MTKIREIQTGGYRTTSMSVPDLDSGVTEWLSAQAREHDLTTLLAHADDGVIWGRVDGGGLRTSHDVFGETVSPPLRAVTLQQVHLFGPQAELLVWRGEDGWMARLSEETPDGEHYDEGQMLWGNQRVDGRDGFTLVSEGRQGLRHAPPVDVDAAEFSADHRPLRLQVRHYLQTEAETGLVRVALSRLVGLTIEPTDKNKREEVQR
jgi:CRISPR-associated protein (TIGR03984 family)